MFEKCGINRVKRQGNMWNERQKITAMEFKMRDLSCELNVVPQK